MTEDAPGMSLIFILKDEDPSDFFGLQFCPRCDRMDPAGERCRKCGTIVKATVDSCATCGFFKRVFDRHGPTDFGHCAHFPGNVCIREDGSACEHFQHARQMKDDD
jgi:hypothetical protein